MSKQQAPDLSPWQAWHELPPDDWRDAVTSLVAKVGWDQATASDDYRNVEKFLTGICHTAGIRDDILTHIVNHALDTGAVLGYALARTQPNVLEEFEDWPRRALELAGLPILEASEDADPPDAT